MSEANSKKNPLMWGILFVIIDSLFFSLMTLFVRLSGELPTMQKAFFRNAIASVVAVIALARSPEKFHIRKGSLPDLFRRSIYGSIGLFCNFYAVDHIPLSDANILNKMSPFFAMLVSAIVLKEIPNFVEILTVIIAFIGAAFIVKPTAGIASLPAVIALIGGAGAGTAYTYVRRLGQKGERGFVVVAFFSVFSCLCCLPPMLIHFVPMSATQWLCLLSAGICGALGQFAVTAAYRLAPAKVISVFDYSQVMFASIWGILFFSELPDGWSVVGYVIIIGMAVFKWYYSLKKK